MQQIYSRHRLLDRSALRTALIEARQYTNAWLVDLLSEQWQVPQLPTINPPLWEWGHLVWFQEWWCLRSGGAVPSRLSDADALYDSGRVPHAARWSLPLPDRAVTQTYAEHVLDATLTALAATPDTDAGLYFFRLALFHELMHVEAFAQLRQTLAYVASCKPAAPFESAAAAVMERRDIAMAGGVIELGARPDAGFVFDNEKWAHPVTLAPYAVASQPVTETEFAHFVDDGGYQRDSLWSEQGCEWLASAQGACSRRAQPIYWRRADASGWETRRFDRWLPLCSTRPMTHVTAFEAEAWCAWAGRRLPTEAEWEHAAVTFDTTADTTAGTTAGFSPAGVWEWTATTFEPYPGFAADSYQDYSAPWFRTHRVARGASAFTHRLLWHPRYRNFYRPERADVFVGFRTCAS